MNIAKIPQRSRRRKRERPRARVERRDVKPRRAKVHVMQDAWRIGKRHGAAQTNRRAVRYESIRRHGNRDSRRRGTWRRDYLTIAAASACSSRDDRESQQDPA